VAVSMTMAMSVAAVIMRVSMAAVVMGVSVTSVVIVMTVSVSSMSRVIPGVEVIGVLQKNVVRAVLGHVGVVLIVSLSLFDEVQVDVELVHVDAPEDHLSVTHDVLSVRVTRNLQLETSAVVVGAQRPEVRLVDPLDSLQLHHLLVGVGQAVVQLLGGPLHENGHAVRHQGPHRQSDQDRDEDGADGVGNHPAEHLHQDRRDNNAEGAESVCEDVEEDALHDLTPAAASMTMPVTSVVRVAVTSVVRMTMTGPAVLEDEDAHEVDEEAEDGHHQQPLVLHLGRLDQPLHSLGENEEGDEE